MDLIYSMNITVGEALTGFCHVIKTLDDRQLIVETKPGEVIKPDDLRIIVNEGMPRYRNPFEKGRLIVKFNVVFPTSIDAATVEQLRKVFPRPITEPMGPEAERVELFPFEESNTSQNDHEAYMEEDADGPQRVHCGSV